MTISDTNSSTSTYRECPRKYELRYELQLEPDTDEKSEALAVGTCWHKAHEAAEKLPDPDTAGVAAIDRTAPSPLWRERLRRLFVLHRWYWRDEEESMTIDPEIGIDFHWKGYHYRGNVDGEVVLADGRRGLLERKTAADPNDEYWRRLRLGTQVGVYGLGLSAAGRPHPTEHGLPDFILYDVLRKPKTKPNQIRTKKDQRYLAESLEAERPIEWHGETIEVADYAAAAGTHVETLRMYGARLQADVVARPNHYFLRRPIARSWADYMTLLEELRMQSEMIEHSRATGCFPRNPDACVGRGYTCEFLHPSLCEGNHRPQAGQDAPAGFRFRRHRHPELDDPQN